MTSVLHSLTPATDTPFVTEPALRARVTQVELLAAIDVTPAKVVQAFRSRERRRLRFARRAVIARGVDRVAKRLGGYHEVAPGLRRTAGCGRVVHGDSVEIRAKYSDAGWNAYPVGVTTCGSTWLCPVCSAKIRTRRSMEVSAIAQEWVNRGGSLGMLTLTMRHHRGHRLGDLLETLREAWRSVQQSRWYREWKLANLGHSVTTLEVTHGLHEANGSWHPHLHLLLLLHDPTTLYGPFTDEHPRPDVVAPDLDELHRRWAHQVQRRLRDGVPDRAHGVNYVELAADAAQYVSKIADEATRSDLKSAARSIWSIVDGVERGEMWAVRGLDQYAIAMHGRRAVVFSDGARALVPELGDDQGDEALAVDDVDGILIERHTKRGYGKLVHTTRYGQVPPLVDRLERIERALNEGDRSVTTPASTRDVTQLSFDTG